VRDSVLRAITEYADYGFDTLPLAPNSKRAIVRGWQSLDPTEMWRDAPTDANIGLRCGGDSQLGVFDADDKHDAQTSANLTRYLAGLGLDDGDYPLIATPNVGRHFYLRVDGNLPGNFRHYRADFGAGEFRYDKGAYVGAPPSIVDGKVYRLLSGDLRSLPRVDVRDVLPILANQEAANTTPIASLERDALTISRRCWKLLQGEGIGRYHSRSEFEQAILASLANTGHDFDAVLSLFLRYPCGGKFRELYTKNPQRAIKWLSHSFDNARQFCESHESRGRRVASSAMQWALSHTWTGKASLSDRAAFIACATIAYQSGCIEFAAPCRTVAELAQVRRDTATNSLHRLTDAGLLVPVKAATVSLANVYRLGLLHSGTLPKVSNVCKCPVMQHDAFRARGYGQTFKASGLGKSSGMVFDELRRSEPLTVKELTERTGRARQTVWRVLSRMARVVDDSTGEILAMVEQDDGGKWRARDDVDLDRIAKALGTFGGNAEQKRRHAEERRAHRESLQREDKQKWRNTPRRCA